LLSAGALAGEAQWKLLQEQAEGHLQRGAFQQAEQFGRSALKEAETLGSSHRATGQSLSTLALALRLQGKHAEALPLAERLVAIRMKQYGPDETATGIALHNNAEILIAMGRYAEAEKLQAAALAAFEKKLGPVHQNSASAMHNMGAIQLKQGRYAEAEKYLRRALAAKEKVLSPGNLSIAHTLESLAAALDGQGRQIEAEKFKRRAAAMRERAKQPGPKAEVRRQKAEVAAGAAGGHSSSLILFRRAGVEARVVAAALGVLEAGDQRPRRAVAGPCGEGGDGLGRSLHHGFHAAVAAIAHPAGHAEPARFAFHGVAESHALHAAGDAEAAGDLQPSLEAFIDRRRARMKSSVNQRAGLSIRVYPRSSVV
jgi:tetratricopeptide (TPR) repeat protein